MTETVHPYMPPWVQRTHDDLLKETGTPATLTRPDAVTYQLDHGNDRVHLMCRWRRRSAKGSKKFTYTSVLTVDGVPREWVTGERAYARLLADPDNDHPNRRPGVKLPPVYPLADDEELPPLVAKVIETLEGSEKVATVQVGHTSMAQRERWSAWTWDLNEKDEEPDAAGWVIDTTSPEGNRIQMHFLPATKVAGGIYMSGLSGVDAQGRDIMSEFGKDIEKALETLLGIKVPQKADDTTTGTTVKGDTRGAVSNSVQVRKATVRRV